jgi:hypothetical protein
MSPACGQLFICYRLGIGKIQVSPGVGLRDACQALFMRLNLDTSQRFASPVSTVFIFSEISLYKR